MAKPASIAKQASCIRSAPMRRRGKALEQAIFEATLAELAEAGYNAMTVEGIAHRARTGKAAIYRRWSTKDDLIVDALDNELEIKRNEPPDTGSIRDDMLALMRAMSAFLTSPAGSAMHTIMNECVHNRVPAGDCGPEMMIKKRVIGPRQEMFFDALRRGVERGEVRPDAVCQRVVDVGPSCMFGRYLAYGSVDDSEVVALVDEVLMPLVRA